MNLLIYMISHYFKFIESFLLWLKSFNAFKRLYINESNALNATADFLILFNYF